MLPGNVNVLAVCTKAGRPTTARFVAAKTYGLYCSQEESIEGVPPVRRLSPRRSSSPIIALTVMKAFNQDMNTRRLRNGMNEAGSIGPETAQFH
jgi:hypothetical protein